MLKPRFQALPTDQPEAFQSAIYDWFIEQGLSYPWRETRDPYAILVSEMMLQQTQISTVLGKGYYQRWLERFPDLASLAAAPEEAVLSAWEGLGYYNRARNLQKLARLLLTDYAGRFPEDPEALKQLPGIGPYTAGALASFAFGHSAPIVDGNIARLFTRLFDQTAPVDKPLAYKWLWQMSEALVPANGAREFNSGLMELGQRICRKSKPRCFECPVSRFCLTPKPESLPIKAGKVKLSKVKECAIFALRDGRLLLHLEQGTRRRNFWKLPLIAPVEAASLPEIYQAEYGITRYRVNLRIYIQDSAQAGKNDRWHSVDKLHEIPIAAPFRKAIDTLLAQQ